MTTPPTPAPARTGAPSPLATDAIEALWVEAAARLGFRVVRTSDAYATSDGRGTIAIGVGEALDPDDAVAQLIFHELCHAMTQGEAALALPDWGLDNTGPRDVVREHACLRLQAHLADAFGLRAAMAPTTEYRGYHDALPETPLADGDDPAIPIAREAAGLAARDPWRGPLGEALAATAAALGRSGVHPTGLPLGPVGETCGGCAWMYLGGRGKAVARCRQAAPPNGEGVRTEATHPACARWEPPVDCATCGACCREAYHSVTVAMRDPVVWKQPDLVERHGHRFEIRREGERCAALVDRRRDTGRGADERIFTCSIYDDRPQACRDFAANGRHCLDARRRVGLSPRA
ncbi:MAG TPA: YkgJ family cysteine cluster protein [Polyangia bacterium]|nr:YkgJ family cysteine cluster protein [Polyangia bacterium]